ncbi:uncharacterized protein LOC112056623 [Bicyclus anynana]|uniref:Uncharacterized protein LOC112056623 n=1 Tax=Bicyclus anynana TaxID=110368 RepID=A0A6J1P4U8_BICAN|nr:uncharacterized protein LOC112056623 [Bicyclus anynana]
MENKQSCDYSDNYQRNKIVISEEFTQDLQNSINEIINEQGYITHNIESRKICTGGNNFLGELYEINVTGKTSDGPNETNLFLKNIIYNDDFKVYSIQEVYAKESFVYNKLWQIYNELQDEAGIPAEDRFKMVKSYRQTNDKAIILDNLAVDGFKTMPRLEVMSIEFAELSIKQLAKFHGLSFVLQNRKPEFFDNEIKTIKQSFVYDDYWNGLAKKMCDFSTSRMDKSTKEKIDKLFLISLDKYPKYMNGLNSSIKCLVHGDYKMNNVLLKEKNGRVSEVIAIDYQQIYYGCPVIDLIYFIYAASDRNFRKQHLYHLRDVYFDSLTSFLKNFEMDPGFSRNDFEKCFEDSLDYALMYTLYMLPYFFVAVNAPDLAKDELLDITLQVDERFYTTMQGIVDEFIDLGIL